MVLNGHQVQLGLLGQYREVDDLDGDELACLARVFGRLGRRLGVPMP